jgi:A118 family predicted phage portal protein
MSNLLSKAAGYVAAFGSQDLTSERMRKAIAEWFDLYYHGEATEEADPCQRIPYTVVTKITRAVFSEYTAKTEDAYAEILLKELGKVGATAMQTALVGGEALIKPVIDATRKQILFGIVPRNNILVFARDAHGNMTDIGTMEVSTAGNCYYTLLERRTVDGKGFLTIQNKLFQSYNKGNLGQQVPLSKLPQYAELPEKYTFVKPVHSVGLINLRTPMVNCVDGSADGVSVYAAAVGLIHNINRNEAQLNGEFDRAESRIVVSADMMQKDVHGNKTLKDKIFVGLDEDPETIGINLFSPALREASFLARKQEYLRNVENVIGLKRGLLSEVEAAERTATEITSSAGEYNLTVIDFQQMWEKAVRETMHVCSVLGQLYKVENAKDIPDDAVIIDWGNGVLYDENKTWEDYKNMVAAGLLAPEVALGWKFGLPCDTPEERAVIRAKYMPNADILMEE